ncbi:MULTISPECIES: acyltransferase family protein [Vibrio]|uniref:Acyltransferase n=1 Tax=Vibrio lentus TaxID=136468 RepID=A0A1B9PRX9_9VIBR|nr:MULTISPECIES: acyltransferase [Vibrio]OCH47087.1 acyltransferase [Vibrio lentus]PME51691.1 acyltransferase [Vibrio lentus]PME56866.1 acyltransferase [Vibrio lentus]PME83915.1 acyltransferase [Vibrio lentus]PMG70522.1 acyltransferase [Vibrio lentus]
MENRIPSLDGLRAASILLVCLGHLCGTVNFPQIFMPLNSLGNFGVKVFFVISGFLITTLLLSELKLTNKINLPQFFIRRMFRLFPAFYFYILCIAIAEYAGIISLLPGDLFHAVTYTMNYHHEREWWLNHTWSLAVEEQFYLLWPLLLTTMGRQHAKSLLLLAVLFVPCIRYWMWFEAGSSPSAMTREFQAIADALAMGCFIAYMKEAGFTLPSYFGSRWFIVVPVAMILVPSALYKLSPAWFYVLGQTLINVCAALMILRYSQFNHGLSFTILNSKLAVWLGVLSYSLYLWQEPFLNSWTREWYATWPINIVLVFIFALISYFLIERPGLKLRKKLVARRKKAKPVNGRKSKV